jgi:hypothetical protein
LEKWIIFWEKESQDFLAQSAFAAFQHLEKIQSSKFKVQNARPQGFYILNFEL